VIEGFFAGTPGASDVSLVYIAWPIVYTFWIGGLAQQRLLFGIHRTAVVATLFIGAYGCLYLLTQLNILPELRLVGWLSAGWESEAFGSHDGYTQLQVAGLNSLPFLVPYVMASVAIQVPSAGRHLFRQICLWTACILGWVVVLAGGRRALILVMFLAPLLVVFFRHFQPETEKRLNRRSVIRLSGLFVIGVVLVFVGLSSIYQFDKSVMWDHFVTGFDISSLTVDEGAMERRQQLIALVHGWLERPLLGLGHGATVHDYAYFRTETLPWGRYEFYYLALLFQTGVIGFTAYAAGVVWIFYRGIKIIREGNQIGRVMMPMLVGCSCMLIASATNPYLARFDGLWILFLPLSVINYRLLLSPGVSTHSAVVRVPA